jgi:enoyl-CoA hydratase
VETDGAIARVTITRADKLNALDDEVIAQLTEAFAGLGRRGREVRCAILTGEGKAFVAGADIATMQVMDVAQARGFAERGHRLGETIEGLSIPVIAAVNGFALGGGTELALACDFVHASEKAKFGQPEVKLGVIPGFGGTQRLARRVGIAKCRELVYTGQIIDAAEALRIGLCDAVHAPGDLLAKAEAVAKTIAEVSPAAVASAKKAIRAGEGRTLAEAIRIEIDAFADCFSHPDQKEGMTAFLEKRPPKF